MNSHAEPFDPEAWNDFVHVTGASSEDNYQLFERFLTFRSRLDTLSKKELIERGWLESTEFFDALGRIFFSINRDNNNILFRKSATNDDITQELWLSLVRERAEHICIANSIPEFKGLESRMLKDIAKTSVDIKSITDLPEVLATHGIILVYLRALSGMKIDGAAFRLSSGHMVIGMTLRFSRLDYFWFTLLHELAHLVLHRDLLNQPVVVDIETLANDENEKAANRFAKDCLVEKSSWRNCEPKYQTGDAPVRRYAEQQHIHPAIVAGLLRKETGNYTRYSDIIHEHDVRKIIFGS